MRRPHHANANALTIWLDKITVAEIAQVDIALVRH